MKKAKFREGWRLYHGLYEIFWKGNRALRVKIKSAQFTPVGTHELASPIAREIGPRKARKK
jgi:hypothetical protein